MSTTTYQTKTIFVQIASYRDPQLESTLDDMFQRAKHPDRIKACVCRQYHPEDEFDRSLYEKKKDDPRILWINVLFSEAKGACWARNQIQQYYSGEDYTLQIDSHMRFTDEWDEKVIEILEGLKKDGFKKPLLTSYVSSFDPENDPAGRVNIPWKMDFDKFTPEGIVFFLPASISGWETLEKPVRARFYSAHFAFADGVFTKEVQHDPNFYFHGEEITIAVRAFTHGYDLFHPHRIIAWHEYTRKGRTKQWDDDKEWGRRNEQTHKLTRKLLGVCDIEGKMEDFKDVTPDPKYGLGTERSLRDYEKYAGILFSKRQVQKYTADKVGYPPNPFSENEEEWSKTFLKKFKYCVDVRTDKIDCSEDDYDFWVVAIHESDTVTLYRKDLKGVDDIRKLERIAGFYKIWIECEISNGVKPSHWVVWPHSKTKGWCEKITGKIY